MSNCGLAESSVTRPDCEHISFAPHTSSNPGAVCLESHLPRNFDTVSRSEKLGSLRMMCFRSYARTGSVDDRGGRTAAWLSIVLLSPPRFRHVQYQLVVLPRSARLA